MTPQVVIRMLPDKSGWVRIHWFVREPKGPIQTLPSRDPTYAQLPDGHPMKPGTRGYIACQRSRTTVTPELKNGVWHPCPHSDDVRAATCPECLATEEAKAMLANLAEIEPNPTS
jgi:hypothetical protein